MATKTKIVKTFELKATYPDNPDKKIVWCVSPVGACVDYAASNINRRFRDTAEPIPDLELDAFEKELRKKRTASLRGYTCFIEPITEEYEVEEDEDDD
jgi:hypothetical protein